MEALALGAWLQLWAAWFVGNADQTLLSSWALWLILLAAFWLARWFAARRLPGRWPALLIVISWAILLLLVWYLRLFVTSSAFWQRQWIVALIQAVQTDSGQLGAMVALLFLIARSFKVGFAALVLALLLLGTVTPPARGELAVHLGLDLPLSLFVGLGAALLSQPAPQQPAREAEALEPRGEVLAPRIVAADPDLDALTAAYEQARYGNREPTPAQLTTLREQTARLLGRLGQREAS